MKIHKQPAGVTITFSPEDYWLRENDDDPDFNGKYCLSTRIDMSYAGKPDQEGAKVIFLDEAQAQIFREAGFGEII